MQNVNLRVQKLIVNKKYFVSIKKKNKKNYWYKVKDPDGIVRDRIKNHKKEKNFFFQNKLCIL